MATTSAQPKKTRLDVNLNTADTKQYPNEYYDQVIALSQDIINKNFDTLHAQNPLLRIVSFDPPGDSTQIKAELHPSRIVLNTRNTLNAGKVFYVIRFKKGTAVVDTKTYVLDGWEYAVECDLEDMVARPATTGMTEEAAAKANAAKSMQDITSIFQNIPGDYSVERLYASLAYAPWKKPDQHLTVVYKGEKRMTWADLGETDSDLTKVLSDALFDWGRSRQAKNLTTVGVKFKLSAAAADKPTFAPTGLRNITYPYKGDDEKETDTSLEGRGKYNCFLWCENVKDRALPNNPVIAWSGNLAIPGKADGTFVLHYKLFLERFLLPQIQGLCQSVELILSEPTTYVDDEKTCKFHPLYSLGCQPEETAAEDLREATDDYFKFEKIEACKYRWYKDQQVGGWDKPSYEYKSGNESRGWGRHDISASSEVTVTLLPDTSIMVIEGCTKYNFNLWMADDQHMAVQLQYKKYKYEYPWKLQLVIKATGDGELSCSLEGCDENGVPASLQDDNSNKYRTFFEVKDIEGKTELSMDRFLRKELGPSVNRMVLNAQNGLRTSGKFVYPGRGVLLFGNPFFSNHGDLLADITYAPLKNQVITIQDPAETQIEPKPLPKPRTADEDKMMSTAIPPKLDWSHSVSYDNEAARAQFTLTVKNQSEDSLAFAYLEFKLRYNEHTAALFDGTPFKLVEAEKPKKKLKLPRWSGSKKPEKTPLADAEATPAASDEANRTAQPEGIAAPEALKKTPIVTENLPSLTETVPAEDLEADHGRVPTTTEPAGSDDADPFGDEFVGPAGGVTSNPSAEKSDDESNDPSTRSSGQPSTEPLSDPSSGPAVKPVKGNTYYWAANALLKNIKVETKLDKSQHLLQCIVTGVEDGSAADYLVFPRDASLKLYFSGASVPGLYRYLIHESWINPDELELGAFGSGDALNIVEVKRM